MSLSYKKWYKKRQTYFPKGINKHRHNYCLKYILEITNVNEHASFNYYNSKEYHNVYKCDLCDSFIPIKEEGNWNGTIFDDNNINKRLPIIIAKTNYKIPTYDFCDLFDVIVK